MTDKMTAAQYKAEIERLKAEKKAVILAHYYVTDEVQEIADYIGDSYYLAKVAKSSDAEVILFAGVSFMGESAKILNPDKKVLMPDLSADCAMAHMADAATIKRMREEYEDLAVVCYINSTAELKCLSDVCVTSANALKIVNALPNKNIFFIPDGNLGRYVKEQASEKNVILNSGYCPVHKDFDPTELAALKAAHPNAKTAAHPECTEAILSQADYIGSTSGIIDFSAKTDAKEIIVCTEQGVGYTLRKENPDKEFYFVGAKCVCADMKLNTLKTVYEALLNEESEVKVSDETRAGALAPLDRMLELAK